MGESTKEESSNEEDYMGDLSQFIPPETHNPTKPSFNKIPDNKPVTIQFSKKKSKFLNWQEQRKIERERKQQEEDEQTLAKIEAPIPQSNIGFKLLKQMGYTPGSSLGKEGAGRVEPVGIDIRRSRAGIGREDPYKEKMKREIEAERKKRKVEDLIVEFGSRKKSQWQSRRVIINFNKAKAVLDQLENKEVVVPEKEDNEEGEQEEEEEEEEITEEDLQDILLKLRDEYQYCLFCGFQYESPEALSSNCPGINEDDH